MSVRINLEIGHEASVRTKRTPEGFTHDWEVFVRGYDSAEIHYYIEKVVFYLHETFQKPKRVVKEPPYSVKESGYAGFNLPIEIYLRNKDEPKKIKFNYDLHLQPNGPTIMNVQKEKYIFSSPNEEFKNKLLRGGGIIVNSLSAQDSNENHTNRVSHESKGELTSKPKLSGVDPLRRSKTREETRAPDSFQSLFGTPITKTTKIFPDLKVVSKDVNKNTTSSSSGNKSEKDKDKNKEKNKYSPNKDKDRERERNKDKSEGDRKKEKEEKRSKDRNKEKEHNKEKSSKKDKSPRPRSPSPRRSPKRPPSPKRPISPSTSKHKEKDDKKQDSVSKEKDRKEKLSEEKSDKKPKKDKRSKEKEYKDSKYKEKEPPRSGDYKDHKSKEQKALVKELLKEKEASPLPPLKTEKKEKVKEATKEETKLLKEPELQHSSTPEKIDKLKVDKTEEKQKHKHKKKDKDRKDKDKEKSHKDKSKDKEKSVIIKPPEPPKEVREEKNNSLFSSPKNEEKQKKAISLFSEAEVESSNSSVSSREETFAEPVEKSEPKKESIFEPKKSKFEIDKGNKEKNKKSKDKKLEKEEKKRKRKIEKTDDEPLEKLPKEEIVIKDTTTSDSEPSSNTSKCMEVDKEIQENSEDYLQILRDLQSKIMNLQDNAELQRVVQLIAETGRYELSQRTFDFDLCLLEKSTVRQLQEFFASSP
ncbi:hypothetical protein AMK59_5923 [Oryctes borbonicus]|uniref:YEATS domain-containing protein n=1 Tax=Oryctes borbonicus TaxID=1629725 RepID=A0A0T6B134_9SCAR|nr:hypothetical protein AMK59_5923 [Oryctes borbonicus]